MRTTSPTPTCGPGRVGSVAKFSTSATGLAPPCSRWPARRRGAGYRGEIRPLPLAEARKTMGDFAEALALNQHIDARKAVRLLGWQPRHGGFLDEADLYYRAWRAHQD